MLSRTGRQGASKVKRDGDKEDRQGGGDKEVEQDGNKEDRWGSFQKDVESCNSRLNGMMKMESWRSW